MKIKVASLLLLLISAATFCFVYFYLPYKQTKEYVAPVEVVVSAGSSAWAVARQLEELGVVRDSEALVKEMVRTGLDRKIKPGHYTLRPSTARDVVQQLEEARPVVAQAALIPGSRFDRLEALLANYGLEAADFYTAMANTENFYEPVRKWLPDDVRARMIFLLPETYSITPGSDIAGSFISSASRLWYERIGRDLPERISKDELFMRGILASIVEGEARVAEERPILAGIFLSRIDKRMRLQSCATVIYCWAELGVKKTSLTYKDLEIDSAYNTYANDGLPPGPICVPSENSWKSALSPQKSDYLFFFADGNGRHIFSKTYAEHLAKQREM